MSFSENVKAELAAQREKLTCCRKAFVYGLLINSQIKESEICFETEQTEVLSVAETAFGEQFGKEPQRSEKNRFGHTRYCLSFKSNSVRDTFGGLAEAEKFSSLIGFRCENCRVHFLKGVFLSAANVSDPMKAYHLEFCIKNALSAKLLFEEFREAGFVPKIANRKNGIGLYFKESGAIEDILTYLGASKMLFECMNDKILREIRNDTNRRANCETGNIMKAVNASQEIITAIKKIENAGLLEALPEDLRKTAEIRMDFPEASLSEMCSKFTPTLSKSGLNHRLTRIKKFAEDIK